MEAIFKDNQYLIRRKMFSFPGRKYQIFNAQGQQVLYSYQKAFKLKEDIRVYADEAMTQERLVIQARQIIDFSAAYDIVDPTEKRKVGAVRRKGLKSILQDTWEFLNDDDQPIATLTEDSTTMALLRRFLTNLIPQSYHVEANGTRLVEYVQNFNPFVLKLNVEIKPEGRNVLDPRVILGAGILLAAVEGRQG